MDIVPMTNFPDIYRPAFLSGELGTLMIVPRERNLTRLYVPFNDQDHEEPFDRSSITLERILARAKKFFEPYTLDFKVCEYWSVYQVGQRVSENNQHPSNRIFLAGDAVHMHSPKVGLGMNTSMQDGYNLGWKVAMAAVGAAKDTAAMLETYRDERYPVAQKLVEFDRTLFGDHGSLDPADFLERHAQFREFSDGRKLDYPESILVHKQTSKQSAATGLIVGESFKHQKVLGHANSQLYWTTKLLHSDGTFRIVLFAGNIGQRAQMNRVKKFCDQLESNRKGSAGDHTSLLHTRFPYRFGHSKKDSKDDARTSQHPAISFHHEKRRTSMISLLAIHSTPQCTESITLFDFPPALYGPFDPEYHGYDFARIFVDEPVHYDRYCDGRAYERWGVDREQGAVVIVRPDMHVGWVGRLEDVDDIEMYFAAVLK
jgi:phenol 2-monooxygenase